MYPPKTHLNVHLGHLYVQCKKSQGCTFTYMYCQIFPGKSANNLKTHNKPKSIVMLHAEVKTEILQPDFIYFKAALILSTYASLNVSFGRRAAQGGRCASVTLAVRML